ncbi:MAG: prepilin-type N-terminal cleavage/methylation domain-containing protein [Alphaproteobacteria bacterium]|nr:prepilin-type N-terminal cleavage/methylation domain-containing protein [Alphaproteobacteria bacterium]
MQKTLALSRGFTLVELAISLTIIGLLIGGILKGQEMVVTARVASTISQVNTYESALITFRDKYDALPGDMPNASRRIPGCNANCDPFAATAGNSVVGAPDWLAGWATQTSAPIVLPATSEETETTLFWLHLLKADMISGVSDGALTGQNPTWGDTHPASKFRGGFVVGTANGGFSLSSLSTPKSTQLAEILQQHLRPSGITQAPQLAEIIAANIHDSMFSPALAANGNGNGNGNGGGGFGGPGCPGQGNGPGQGAGCGLGGGNGGGNGGGGGGGGNGGGGGGGSSVTGPSGIVIAMLHVPTSDGIEELSAEGMQPMTPGQAAKIDRKMDDGYPASGSVYAYGLMNSCFTSAAVLQYNEAVTSYDCGLVFRIQK